MPANIEIKAQCKNPEITETKIKTLTDNIIGLDLQSDTYFKTKNGRFKLRESTIDGNYLIPYLRPNNLESKRSDYDKIPVQDAQKVKSLFENILGIQCVVRKKRKIYLYENVRIHLDEVDQLGSFIELEAVFNGRHEEEKVQRKKIEFLMNELSIGKESLVAESYENLMQKL